MTPPKKNERLPPSPSFSHNVMDSFASRRASGSNFARFAFNIYGGNSAGNNLNSSPPSNSNPYLPLSNSNSSSSTSTYSKTSHLFQNLNSSDYNELQNSLKFLSSNEILTFDSSHVDPSIIAIGGQRLCQILKINEEGNEILIETDLNHSVQANRNSKAGTVSDLKFGYGQYRNFIAAATTSGNINLYNLGKSKKIVTTLADHSRTVNSVDFSPVQLQTDLLTSGSQDGTIKLWDLRSKNNAPSMTMHGAVDPVRGVKFSPHQARKIVGIFDSGVIKKYDLRNIQQPERKMNAHTGPGLSIDWHDELDYIVSGGRDKQIQVWNMSSASNDCRVPEYVINAPGPLAHVKWCPQSSVNSIVDARVAASLFGDDPLIEIWNLKRKYVPEYTIENHYSQVTSVLWKNSDTLWSSSKDKTFVQHDLTRLPKFLDNLAKTAVDWANNNEELVFILQDKDGYKANVSSNPFSAPALPSHSSEVNLPTYANASPSSLSFTPLNTSNSSPFDRPSLTRSMTHRPQLLRMGSNQQQQQLQHSQQQQLVKPVDTASPYLCPVKLPFHDDQLVFEFMSTHYLTLVPEGMDFSSVCEYNAMIAASARRFRESQTWKVVKASVLWYYEQEKDEVVVKKKVPGGPQEVATNYRSMTNSRTNSELDIGSLGSRSTGNYFGSSPNVGSLTLGFKSANFTPPPQPAPIALMEGKANLGPEETTLKMEGVKLTLAGPWQGSDDKNEQTREQTDQTLVSNALPDSNSASNALPDSNSASALSDSNSTVNLPDSSSQPIEIKSPVRKRTSFNGFPSETVPYTFTGSIPDYDDETKGYQSSSAGRSSTSLRSSMSSHRHDSFNGNTWKSLANSKMTPLPKTIRSDSRKSVHSGKSALSRVLREQMANNEEAIADDDDDENDENGEKGETLLAPWSPQLMVKEAAEYYAEQGNITMCATLLLLFLAFFDHQSISRYQLMDWIHTYHEILCRRLLFTTLADVLKVAAEEYPVMRQKGQTETSLRFFCMGCQKLVVNERSKQKLHDDGASEVDFGYWYCDNCNKITGNCCYCNELIKGLTIATMPCGHIAHFGCYRSWFFVEEERCCPACAYPVIY